MVFLRRVRIHNKNYFYLFHLVKENNKLLKFSKYLGKKEPSSEKLKILKANFFKETKKNPEKFVMNKDKNTILLLQEIQEKKGFISEEEIVKLSKELNIPAVELYGLVTFYSEFKLVKPGKYKIKLCKGTACHVKNSESLLKILERTLKIKSGETTSDGKFSLEGVNCIGACAMAPAMMINEKIYGKLTEEKIKEIIQKLK